MKAKILLLFGLAVAVLTASANAMNVGGKAYVNYSYNLSTGANDMNSFNIEQLYLNFDDKFSDQLKWDVMLGTYYDTNTNYMTIYDKYAYLTYDGFVIPDLQLKLGMQDTPLIGYMEGLWGNRYVSKTFEDSQGVDVASDLGISFKYSLPANFGEFVVGVYNGEGFRYQETNKFKTFRGRLTLEPIEGLKATGFASYGDTYNDGTTDDPSMPIGNYEQQRYEGILSYQCPFLKLAANVFGKNDTQDITNSKTLSTGIGSFAVIKLDAMDFFARYDVLSSNKGSPVSGYANMVAGVSYKFSENITSSLDEQVEYFQNGSIQNVIYSHMLLTY
jgi:hypothetical protein